MDTTLSAPIGQLLDGRYLVEARLARGGMATVYLGRDVRLDRAVALKIAHPELARDREFAARFLAEARAVARLSSPNVVAVFDQGTTGDIHYLAMEYVPGPTLRELLNARGRLGPREALDICEGVLTGLAAAHHAGIVHRDVKPENVLLGTGPGVKVADFGLARAAAGMGNTTSGVLIGTAAYLAPEQVAAGRADARSDVYATGVMLFEMLTGRQPHTGENPLAVAYQHVNAVVPAPSSVLPELPSALDTLVALSTSRDPELRPPDAWHFLQAISQVRSGLPIAQGRAGFTVASTEPLHGPGQPGGRPAAGPALNHTLVVPAGQDAAGHSAPRAGRGYREPFLQRWLFSRRILAVLAAAVIGVAAWWLLSGQYFGEPGVTGLPVAAARAELASAGLTAHVGPGRYSYTVAAGRVTGTDPAPGARVRHGEVITLYPSLGPEKSRVPDVTGEQLAAARRALTTAKLKPGSVTSETSDTVGAGVVIATTPVAGTQWPRNKPVGIVVSAGLPLPDFVGQPFQAAQGQAQSAGITLQPQSVTGSTQPAGTIVSQSPAPGTALLQGEVVTVGVSAGPPMVNVPNVDGLSQAQATQELQAAGFRVQVRNQFGGAAGNTVTNYQPQGQAPQGATVTIDIGFNF